MSNTKDTGWIAVLLTAMVLCFGLGVGVGTTAEDLDNPDDLVEHCLTEIQDKLDHCFPDCDLPDKEWIIQCKELSIIKESKD
jgi:hypothetical protein